MLVFSFLMTLVACGDESFNTDNRSGLDESQAERGIDRDGDGYGDEAAGGTDCDDTDAAINPGALEVCDMVDNDCDNDVDDDDNSSVGLWWGADMDMDGYVASVAIVAACDMSNFDELVEQTGGDPDLLAYWIEVPTVQYGTDGSLAYPDCDDDDDATNPWATEVCDGVDNDCDATTADGPMAMWYADVDSDGYGDAAATTMSCESSVPDFVSNDDDCNDASAAVNPAALEMCDYIDNDCDTSIDGSDSVDATTWFRDADIDGYGVTTATIEACFVAPDGYAAVSTDCDDADDTVNPDATEVCDSVDNNCDGSVDDGMAAPTTWYRDSDGDTYGDSGRAFSSCTAPASYVGNSTDCDDTDVDVNPTATEVSNGYDDDCDGSIDEGVSCVTEVYVLNNQGDATVITADATDSAFNGDWWNGTMSSVSGILATETNLGGVYREYGFVGDMCFVAGTTEVELTGSFDLGENLCVSGGMGAILDAYENGVALDVTEVSDGMGGCTYVVSK